MLETLRIQNYALIDDVDVDFTEGFNVLTGETGAGKSIIVDALSLALGARASAEAVRGGAKRATVDAVFRIPEPPPRLGRLLEAHDIVVEDGELILSRAVTAEGRSRALVCGRLVPVAVLAQVGDELVDLHGQHEHQSLLRTDRQLELLDAFAGAESPAAEVASMVAELRAIDRDLESLESDDRDRARRVDFLRFEINEIQAASLEAGEEEDLKGRRNIIANAERIASLTGQTIDALYEGDERPAIDALDAALGRLDELAAIDERFAAAAQQVQTARESVAEVASEVRRR